MRPDTPAAARRGAAADDSNPAAAGKRRIRSAMNHQRSAPCAGFDLWEITAGSSGMFGVFAESKEFFFFFFKSRVILRSLSVESQISFPFGWGFF